MKQRTDWTLLVIVGGLVLLFAMATTITLEFYEAKSFCNEQEGEYSFDFKQMNHYCSEEEISRYTEGWDFNKFHPNLKEIIINP